MKRFTNPTISVQGVEKTCCTHFFSAECVYYNGHCSDGCPWEEAAWNRLAAYEETGLEPEEIEKIAADVESGFFHATARRYGIPVDRLRELAEADRDGRCVVLPQEV